MHTELSNSSRPLRQTVMKLLVATAASLMTGAVAAQSTAVLTDFSGAPGIFQITDGRAQPVSSVARGHKYDLPLEVETGAGDRASFQLPNSRIEIAPNTVMRIAAPEAGVQGVLQRVLQQSGSSLFNVQKGSVERFQVDTPFLVSVVKGTTFSVLVEESGATVVLHEGALWVSSVDGLQHLELGPGGVAFAGRDGLLRQLRIEATQAGTVLKDLPVGDGSTVAALAGGALGGAGGGVIALAGSTAGNAVPSVPRVDSVVNSATTVTAPVNTATGALTGATSTVTTPLQGTPLAGLANTVDTTTQTVSTVVSGVATTVATAATIATEVVPATLESVATPVTSVIDAAPAATVDPLVSPVTTLVNDAVSTPLAPLIDNTQSVVTLDPVEPLAPALTSASAGGGTVPTSVTSPVTGALSGALTGLR
jgi:hypothetical protein